MEDVNAIRIGLPGYRIEALAQTDAGRAQPLFEACADYALMESGEPPASDAATNEFLATPPGRTTEDKAIIGLSSESDRSIVALIITDRGWPDERSWWIALMLVHPDQRGSGLGTRFADAVLNWIERQDVDRVELAVFEENCRAERFWHACRFRRVRSTESRAIGKKTHVLHVMRRSASR